MLYIISGNSKIANFCKNRWEIVDNQRHVCVYFVIHNIGVGCFYYLSVVVMAIPEFQIIIQFHAFLVFILYSKEK